MRKIIEYDLISARLASDIFRGITRSIEDGWEPLGGVAAFYDDNNQNFYHQAMVKYEDNEARPKNIKIPGVGITNYGELQQFIHNEIADALDYFSEPGESLKDTISALRKGKVTEWINEKNRQDCACFNKKD